MKTVETNIKDCFVLQNDQHHDERGVFCEIYSDVGWDEIGKQHWKQVNCSRSQCNVLRGLHVAPFAKLVTCVFGHVYDVVVDMRKDSPTYLQWTSVDLKGDELNQIYIPPSCAHGFLARSIIDNVVVYSQTATYDPKAESSVNWRDPTIAVQWPNAPEYIVSQKDQQAPFVAKRE